VEKTVAALEYESTQAPAPNDTEITGSFMGDRYYSVDLDGLE
jgi:hypothetical protein